MSKTFIHYLGSFYVPSTVLSTRFIAVNETNISAFMEFTFSVEKATVNKMYSMSAAGKNKNRRGVRVYY